MQPLDGFFFSLVTISGKLAPNPVVALGGLSISVASDLSDAPDVPEPSTWLLIATGLVGLRGYSWRKRPNPNTRGG
jgi:hypothetical protein